MILQCAVYHLTLIRIHRLECYGFLGPLDLAGESVCQIYECLFSLGSVVLRVEYDSCIFTVFLIYHIARETLNRVECCASLAYDCACILTGDLYEYQLFSCFYAKFEVYSHLVSDVSEELFNRMSLYRIQFLYLIQHRVLNRQAVFAALPVISVFSSRFCVSFFSCPCVLSLFSLKFVILSSHLIRKRLS